MKLCIFPGTFNPIHNAHIRIADFTAENFGFDKILFIPSYKPPHKEYDENLSAHRFNMVKLAIKNDLRFEISDIEYESENKSYTYLTVKELYKRYDVTGKISIIIGTDAFKDIESWYETDKLKRLVDFIVFKRENNLTNFDVLRNLGYNFKLENLDFLDISSTELRKKIYNNEDISKFVNKEVEEYIKENGLYGYKKMA